MLDKKELALEMSQYQKGIVNIISSTVENILRFEKDVNDNEQCINAIRGVIAQSEQLISKLKSNEHFI